LAALATHLEGADFAPGIPVAVARCDSSGVIEAAVTGAWPTGRPVSATDSFYVASLAKQFTGAAAALLVQDGYLDPDLPIARYLDDLPAWSAGVTTRQLAHHMAGLPAAGAHEGPAAGDWTEEFALSVLRDLPELVAIPGTSYAYSNLGYILLARLVATVSGQPFDRFVAARLFEPLDINDIGFVADVAVQPQAVLLGPSLPLTHGDGGLWATATGMVRWMHRQNGDAMHIAALVEAPGRLSNGDPVPYGWGLGLRQHRGWPLLIHGGEWTGAVAKAVRSPELGLAIVAMAAGARFEVLNQLIEALVDDALR